MRDERRTTMYSAWVTWPDGYRTLVTADIDQLDALYRKGCDVEIYEP